VRGPDPREWAKSRCACPRIDAADCIETRSGRWGFGEDDRRRYDREACECSCHDPAEDDYDDYEPHGDALGEREKP
jgi:hypothetical protein